LPACDVIGLQIDALISEHWHDARRRHIGKARFIGHLQQASTLDLLGVFFATSGLSGSMLGVGMWFWIIGATGVFVAISQFVPRLRDIGIVAASILGVIAILAALLALFVMMSIGGSGPSNEEVLLILGFITIAVFGFSLVRVNR